MNKLEAAKEQWLKENGFEPNELERASFVDGWEAHAAATVPADEEVREAVAKLEVRLEAAQTRVNVLPDSDSRDALQDHIHIATEASRTLIAAVSSRPPESDERQEHSDADDIRDQFGERLWKTPEELMDRDKLTQAFQATLAWDPLRETYDHRQRNTLRAYFDAGVRACRAPSALPAEEKEQK